MSCISPRVAQHTSRQGIVFNILEKAHPFRSPNVPNFQTSSSLSPFSLSTSPNLSDSKMVVIEPASSVDNVETTQNQAETAIREAEGFETASDGEGDGGPYEDAFTDDQLKQRQLAQANDAKADGNDLFKAEKYEDALLKYEIAIQIATEMPSSVEVRSICHANRAACFSKLGKYEDTIKECTKALELNPLYLKALIRRAEAHEKLEHFEEAIADMKKVLELDQSHDQASKSIRRLEPLAAEKREKMKEEMIGKLKEMGNSILGRFGMSVDNFKAVKDPNTGSYSISFQR